MQKVNILDCTLRDGGYVNNWEFGYNNIVDTIAKLEKSGVNIIELGFMRDEEYYPNRAVYNSIDQIKNVIGKKEQDVTYAALIEMANYFPPEMLAERCDDGPDLIRYSFWLRCIDEAYEYAKQITDKGYLLGVQPTRVEQYSDRQFADMCERFSKLNPYAIYIVDTFGLLTKEQLIRYAKIADNYVGDGIRIGYHAHNNMQQAFSNATTFVELDMKHNLVLDASVFGMGRGAGNLNTEMIASYLNLQSPKRFDLNNIFSVWDSSLKEIYSRLPWGYNLEYFIAANNQCNPNYAVYYLKNHPEISMSELERLYCSIQGQDKYLYSDEKAEQFYKKIKENNG